MLQFYIPRYIYLTTALLFNALTFQRPTPSGIRTAHYRCSCSSRVSIYHKLNYSAGSLLLPFCSHVNYQLLKKLINLLIAKLEH